MPDESLTPLERLRVHLIQSGHDDDAQDFADVDWFVKSYLLTSELLSPKAIELQDMLREVVESWTPTNGCPSGGTVRNTEAIGRQIGKDIVIERLEARVAELEAAYWSAMTEIEAFDQSFHAQRHIEGWCGVCEMMERITTKHGRPTEPKP